MRSIGIIGEAVTTDCQRTSEACADRLGIPWDDVERVVDGLARLEGRSPVGASSWFSWEGAVERGWIRVAQTLERMDYARTVGTHRTRTNHARESAAWRWDMLREEAEV